MGDDVELPVVEWIDQKIVWFMASGSDRYYLSHSYLHVLPIQNPTWKRIPTQCLTTIYGDAPSVVFLLHGPKGFLHLSCLAVFWRIHGILERSCT